VTDSLYHTLDLREQDYINNIKNRHLVLRPRIHFSAVKKVDSLGQQQTVREINNVPPAYRPESNSSPAAVPGASPQINAAIELCHNSIDNLRNSKGECEMRKDNLVRYEIEWHRKFTLSLACLIIFFIGAPLGAIVRKGGLGTPMVISVLLFLLYHVLTITGEKMAKSGTLDVFSGMWFSAFILTPIGLTLTWLATRESSLTNIQTWLGGIGNFFTFKFLRRRKS
jgi:lipopolysaccharide export system permease protein